MVPLSRKRREPPIAAYPARIGRTTYGACLLADRDLPQGAVVARFDGWKAPGYLAVPEPDVCHALLVGPDDWLVPTTEARYINHSCEPNCFINDDLDVVTRRPVPRGEELTFAYNWTRPGEELPDWDPRWTFECRCGAMCCQGLINGWVSAPANR